MSIPNDTESFSILSGNTDGIFSIDNSGWVRVADEAALQSTAAPSYTLTIRVTDSGSPPRSTTATAMLNITETNVIVPTDACSARCSMISAAAPLSAT